MQYNHQINLRDFEVDFLIILARYLIFKIFDELIVVYVMYTFHMLNMLPDKIIHINSNRVFDSI